MSLEEAHDLGADDAWIDSANVEEPEPVSVLFVCTANICRSAFAQQLSRHLLGDDPTLRVNSAGTHGWVDHPVDEPMAAELKARGASADGFASRALSMSMVDRSDLVLTATMAHRQFILDDRPSAVWRTFTLGQFARLLPDVSGEPRGRQLLAACRAVHRPATARDDVTDPFRRGPDVAAAAAKHIDAMLRQIIPRLVSPG